jgi:hypothetical protein
MPTIRPYTNMALNADEIKVLPVSSTVYGFVSSSDVGRLVVQSSNNYGLMIGSTGDVHINDAGVRIAGLVSSVPAATTPGSTVPFYIRPIMNNALYQADTTAAAATTDIGKYIGVSRTTTLAGARNLTVTGIGNAPGTTNGLFFRITDVDSTRRKVIGTFSSTHLV